MDAEFYTFLTDPFNIGLRVAGSTEGRRSNIHPDQIEQTVEGQSHWMCSKRTTILECIGNPSISCSSIQSIRIMDSNGRSETIAPAEEGICSISARIIKSIRPKGWKANLDIMEQVVLCSIQYSNQLSSRFRSWIHRTAPAL